MLFILKGHEPFVKIPQTYQQKAPYPEQFLILKRRTFLRYIFGVSHVKVTK